MDKEIFKKQLLYRSMHRGCKETDILLGKFIVGHINAFDDEKLKLYEQFIDEDDLLIYDWILGRAEVDAKYVELVGEVRVFHNV